MINKTSSSIKFALITGLIALLGTISGGVLKGYWDMKLSENKHYSDLIMKALESDSPKERLASLNLMIKTNLIKDTEIKEGFEQYLAELKKDTTKQTVPQIRSTQNFPSTVLSSSEIMNLGVKKAVQGDLEAAISYYNIALTVEPNNPHYIYNYKGYALFKQNKLEEAEEALMNSIESKSFSWSHFNIAKVYWARGLKDKAIDHIRKSIFINPQRKKSIKTDSEFPGLKDSSEYQDLIN